MRYKFIAQNIWEEVEIAVGRKPQSLSQHGDEIIFDFGDVTLTAAQEIALIKLMGGKAMLRGKLAKLVKKGIDVELTLR